MRVHSFSRRPSQQWSSRKFIVIRWDMPVLQCGGCKGAGHTLALTLIWLHRGEKRANRQADIHGKLSTEKRTQDKLCHAVSMLPSLRGLPVLHKAEESCPCEWLHPSAVEGRAVTQGCLCVCAVFSWHPALPPPLWQP